MFEAVCESWQHKFKLSRAAAVLLCGGIVLAVGVFLEAEPLVGSWMDFITIVVVPIGAMLGAIAVYYVLGWPTIRRELEKYPGVTLDVVRRVIIAIREEKLPDPRVMGNAGSFFMNPIVGREQFEALQAEYPQMPFYEIDTDRVKIPAGWMIDQCGWKGKALGPAAVHDKQALVLVNRGGAKGADVIALSDAVRASVRAKFGIDIHPEVNFI